MIAELEEQVLQLDRKERIRLKERLEASLVGETAPLSDRHKKILDERMQRIESGDAVFISRDEFETRMNTRIKARQNEG